MIYEKVLLLFFFGLIAFATSLPAEVPPQGEEQNTTRVLSLGEEDQAPRGAADTGPTHSALEEGSPRRAKGGADPVQTVYRKARELFAASQTLGSLESWTGRQAAGSSNSSISDLLRPALIALVSSFSSNLATSFTNAITAALSGRRLDQIPMEAFMTSRSYLVEEPVSEHQPWTGPQAQARRHLKKRKRVTSSQALDNRIR